MSLSVFNQKVITTTTQLVQEQLNVFNAASNGALVLGNGQQIADFVEQVSIGLISGLVTERNPYAPAGTDAHLKVLAQLLQNSVNLSGKVGPFVITSGMMAKINRSAAEVAAAISAQAAQGVIQFYLKAGVGALNSAIGGNSAAVYTQPARANGNAGAGSYVLALQDLPLAAGKFGDAQGTINTWVMDGATWSNFIGLAVIPNVEQLFSIGNINLMGDGLGRKFLITDAINDAGVTNSIIGLVPQAAVITTSGVTTETGTRLGGENIERIMQGEFDFNLALKGYKLKKSVTDKFTGKVSPKVSDVVKAGSWETYTGDVDGPAYQFDQYDENHDANGDPLTTPAANVPKGTKQREKPQTAPAISVKETAGVLIKLTPTT